MYKYNQMVNVRSIIEINQTGLKNCSSNHINTIVCNDMVKCPSNCSMPIPTGLKLPAVGAYMSPNFKINLFNKNKFNTIKELTYNPYTHICQFTLHLKLYSPKRVQ